MQSVYKFFFAISFIFLTSCFFGPIKELKYQIEDTFEDDPEGVINPVPAPVIENSLNLQVSWNKNFLGKPKNNYKFFYQGKKLFVIDDESKLYIVDIDSGELINDFFIDNDISAGLAGNQNSIFYVSADGYLCSIDLNGVLLWKIFVGPVLSPPLVTDHSIVVKTLENKFFSVSILNGSLLWKYNAVSPPLTINSYANLIYSDGAIFSGLPAGKILSLNAVNGSLFWENTYSIPKGTTDIERANDSTSSPIVNNSEIYIISSRGHLVSLSRISGKINWSRALSSFYGININNDTLFITHNSGTVYAINKYTNKVRWKNQQLKGRALKKGIIYNNFLFVSDYEGYLYALDLDDGSIQAKIQIGNVPLLDSFIVIDKFLFAINSNGTIFKINIAEDGNYSAKKNLPVAEDNEQIQSISGDNKSIIDNLIFWD